MQKTNHNLSQNLVLSHLNLSHVRMFESGIHKAEEETLMARASIVNAVHLNAESEQDLRIREAVWHVTAELITGDKQPVYQTHCSSETPVTSLKTAPVLLTTCLRHCRMITSS